MCRQSLEAHKQCRHIWTGFGFEQLSILQRWTGLERAHDGSGVLLLLLTAMLYLDHGGVMASTREWVRLAASAL